MSQIIDTENYTGGREDNSYKEIIMRHLERLGKFASAEMRGGYEDVKAMPVGNTIMQQTVYVPDAREVYTNSVNHLHDLLLPTFDKEMYEASELITEQYEELEKEKQYKEKSWKVARKLFQEISKFLKRDGYLQVNDVEAGD